MRILLAALALAGCAPPPESTPPPVRDCNAAAVQVLIGRQRTTALVQEVQRLSHADAVRVLRPGQMVTMEYRADRVNIRVDAQDKVVAITCG